MYMYATNQSYSETISSVQNINIQKSLLAQLLSFSILNRCKESGVLDLESNYGSLS